MDTFPFHWDTLAAPQCLVMACLCPDECHEGWLCHKLLCFTYLLATGSGAYHFRQRQSRNRRRKLHPPEAKGQRCGELTSRLSSHLTFAYLCVAIRAIHSSRCISAGLLMNFIEVRLFSVTIRAIHLTVNMPLRILVGVHRVFPPLTLNF